MNRELVKNWLWPLAVFGLLAAVPKIAVDVPRLFDQPIDSPGTLALLASCLVFGALALTYDIQFGYTGLLSFGHALYIALGCYLSNIAITQWHWQFWQGVLFTIAVAFVLSVVLGFVSLRATGIAFAMVTLAFSQAGAVLALKDPHHWTHGEEGLGADYTKLPQAFVGIFNTKNLYWLALAFLALVFFSGALARRLVTRPCLGRDPRQRAARRGARDAIPRVQAAGLRRLVGARRCRRASSTCSSSTGRRSP